MLHGVVQLTIHAHILNFDFQEPHETNMFIDRFQVDTGLWRSPVMQETSYPTDKTNTNMWRKQPSRLPIILSKVCSDRSKSN